MNKFVYIIFLLLLAANACAQDSIPAFSYKMPNTQNAILVYRDKNGAPDFSAYKYWDRFRWFFLVPGKTAEVNGVKYVQIIIGNGTKLFTDKPWSAQAATMVDTSDWNKPLWISNDDFNHKSVNNFPRFSRQMVYGALTVPFRIRPAVDDHASSIFNGDFNLGFFLGYRAAIGNKFGISLIGSGGISSLSQNSSNNRTIKDTSTQSMFAVTYAGGLIFDWAKNLQFGVVMGADNGFDKLSAGYIYQNKWWIAFSLNYKFLNYKTDTKASQ
jgi:hypothetical protein